MHLEGDGTPGLRIRDLRTGRVERVLPQPTGLEVDRTAHMVASDGRLLFRFNPSRVFVQDLATGEDRSKSAQPDPRSGACFAAAPDGTFVVFLRTRETGKRLGEGRVEWELQLVRVDLVGGAERVLARFPESGPYPGYLRVPGGNREVVFARYEPAPVGQPASPALVVRVLDAGTGAETRSVRIPTPVTLSNEGPFPLIHPNGSLVMGLDASVARIVAYDLGTGRERWRLPDRAGRYSAAAFSLDGRWLATGDGNGCVQTWDAETGRRVAEFDSRRVFPLGTRNAPVARLDFDPKGHRLAASLKFGGTFPNPPGVVVVWDFAPEPAAPTK